MASVTGIGRRIRQATLAFSLLTIVANASGQNVARDSAPIMVTFEIRTAAGRIGGASDDQITIVFSDVSAGSPSPPSPLLGADVLEEFSFSGKDATTTAPLVFQRRVYSLRFLEARYIRLINQGEDGWAGQSLTMSYQTENGAKVYVLQDQSLYPRLGRSKENGLERFNSGQWLDRVYWEAELQRIRRDRR